MTRISDSTMSALRMLAEELLDARDDAEAHEKVRSFLDACRRDHVAVDDVGDLVDIGEVRAA